MPKDKIIKFHKQFKESIREGIKTSTIRRHFNGKVGDKYRAIVSNTHKDYIEPNFIAIIKITDIRRIRFDEIDNDMAKTEGYFHKDILASALLGFYPELADPSLLYYIQFENHSLKDPLPDILRSSLNLQPTLVKPMPPITPDLDFSTNRTNISVDDIEDVFQGALHPNRRPRE